MFFINSHSIDIDVFHVLVIVIGITMIMDGHIQR